MNEGWVFQAFPSHSIPSTFNDIFSLWNAKWKGGKYLAKGYIFKIVLLVATVVLAALQGIAEMEEDSVTNNIL